VVTHCRANVPRPGPASFLYRSGALPSFPWRPEDRSRCQNGSFRPRPAPEV